MTSPLSDFITLTFVDEGERDPQVPASLVGKTFLLPPEYLASLGSGPTNPGAIPYSPTIVVRGYLRTEPDGTHSWVMTGEITNAQRAALLGIPGGLGWIDQSLTAGTPLRIYYNVGRQLRQAGISGPDILNALNALYDAAAANRNAQIAAGG